jgi:class 3 adenylate cyclase/tetratricopeptide (TPR) repeat protein
MPPVFDTFAAFYDARVICPRCSRENPDQARFCLECGRSLGEGRSMREERKVVTVLFADLVGFTSQAEVMDPEEVRALLQPYHSNVRHHLERYGGTVEKFIGDAVMAVFGAPIAHEDDPERAVRAALAVQESLGAGGQLHARIGITTGEALVALEARPESGEGLATGDVVNTASRLQEAAPVDGILVDETTYRASVREVVYREHPDVSLKGKAQPVRVWQAVSAGPASAAVRRQSGLAPLVGRTREVDVLTDALARVRSEAEPQLVTLVGVPGIGKSRIVWELLQQVDAAADGVAWLQGRSLPYSDAISFWALGEMIKAEAGILDTDSTLEASSKLARSVDSVAEVTRDAAWMEAHLRPLAGLAAATDLRGDHRGEAFAAWRRYLEALADRRPLVLVFEDLHWADDGLLDFIDHLLEWATGVPMLIVGTGRPELFARRPNWGGGKANAVTTTISPLSDADTGRLVEALIDDAAIPHAVREAVLQRAQGNPLYAEEFARLLAAGGRITDLPESVQGIISARLDGLSRPEKELLQVAAVVGKVFWSGAVAAVLEDERAAVEQRLHALERKEFVRRERRSSVAGETEYAFRHILVRDVAYGQIPRGERAERHARAAAWIESLGRPADHAELLAQHYLSAIELARASGRPTDRYASQARTVLTDAGGRTMALNAFAQAAQYYRGALDLTPPDDPDRPAALFRYGKALRIAQGAGADVLADAEAQLRESGDLETAAEAAVLQAELAWFEGDGEAAEAHLARAELLIHDLPASPSKAYVLAGLSRYHMVSYRHGEAIRIGTLARRIAEELSLEELLVSVLINIGSARAMSGDRGGIGDLERAMDLAKGMNSAETARAMSNLATVLQDAGELKRAYALWRAAGRTAGEYGDATSERFYRAGLVWILYDEGAWDEALRLSDEFIADTTRRGGHRLESLVRCYRGRVRFARDDSAGADEEARRSVLTGLRTDRFLGIASVAFAGWLAVQTGKVAEANKHFDAILEGGQVDKHVGVELPLGLVQLDRSNDLRSILDAMPASRMRELFALIHGGRLAQAGELAEEMGLLPSGAILRLEAARRLARDGKAEEARHHAGLAADFWRSTGAVHYIREADRVVDLQP